ncbi:Armadillo repeat-containing protein 2 [Rhizophlyctis rosea]|nr:Armadillo repeat-containing protein 2 [Rhizophlyctis rosea]
MEEDSVLSEAEDVMLNVARVLSKLSSHPTTLLHLGGRPNITRILHLMVAFQDNKPLLLRLAFLLGNLTTSTSLGQHAIIADGGGLGTIMALLGEYVGAVMEESDDGGEEEVKDAVDIAREENEDVIVKLVRLIANLALDPQVGKRIVGMLEVEGLIDLLANFTYYVNAPVNVLLKRRVDIVNLLLPFLMDSNPETVMQTSRVFGNLSRFEDVQNVLATCRGTELFTILLDHQDPSVLFQACGVIINLLRPRPRSGGYSGVADGRVQESVHARIVVENGGVEKLLDVLEYATTEADVLSVNVAGKALHNLRAGGDKVDAGAGQRIGYG